MISPVTCPSELAAHPHLASPPLFGQACELLGIADISTDLVQKVTVVGSERFEIKLRADAAVKQRDALAKQAGHPPCRHTLFLAPAPLSPLRHASPFAAPLPAPLPSVHLLEPRSLTPPPASTVRSTTSSSTCWSPR